MLGSSAGVMWAYDNDIMPQETLFESLNHKSGP